jgi:hypothetical protein
MEIVFELEHQIGFYKDEARILKKFVRSIEEKIDLDLKKINSNKKLAKSLEPFLDGTQERVYKYKSFDLADIQKLSAKEQIQMLIDSRSLAKASHAMNRALHPCVQSTYLHDMALIFLVTMQEELIKKYFTTLLQAMPSLKGRPGKELTNEAKLSYLETFCSSVLHVRLRDVFPRWQQVTEVRARRNLIVHNRGFSDDKYCKMTKYRKKGIKMHVNFKYLENTIIDFDLLLNFLHRKLKRILLKTEKR